MEYDTIGGLVYHRIGGVPAPGDSIDVGGLRLTVETTDGRRVGKVLVTRRDKVPHDDNGTLGDGGPTHPRGERRGASKR